MKKKEELFSALAIIGLGVLFIVLKANLIEIFLTIAGVALIVYGVVDLIQKSFPTAIVKGIVGVLIIVCGWLLVKAALYILSALLLIYGILTIYDRVKHKVCADSRWHTVLIYAMPGLCILIGALLLFNQGNTVDWVFVVVGILTVIEGGLWLLDSIWND